MSYQIEQRNSPKHYQYEDGRTEQEKLVQELVAQSKVKLTTVNYSRKHFSFRR